MKKSGILVSLVLGTMIITGCGNKSKEAPASSAVTIPSNQKMESIIPNHSVLPINLRQVDAFAILAHSAILDTPTSAVSGKVGVRPGVRADLGLKADEVNGGATEMYAADDLDINATTFVTKAKIDLINAYNEIETMTPDADKIDLFAGNLGNKVLPAGIYKFNSRVTIPNDLTLEGTDTDVFIFKIAGDLRIGSDVTIKLIGGVQPKNIFWQVGDNVLIKARSAMVGTVISQLTFEMKEQASLVGRAFSKNEKIILDKNTITKP